MQPRSVLVEFPSGGEVRLSVSVEYREKAPTQDQARKVAVRALRDALKKLDEKEIADMGFRESERERKRVQVWSIS